MFSLPSGASPRLLELATEHNVVQQQLPPKYPRKMRAPNFKADGDESHAKRLLSDKMSTKTYGKPVIRSKTRMGDYKFKNITLALSELVESGGSAGVAQCLLEESSGVEVVKKDAVRLEQAKARNDLLDRAVRKENLEMAELFAARSDQASLNSSLNIAFERANHNLVKILLEYGADAQVARQYLEHAAQIGDSQMISIFLKAPKPPNPASIDSALLKSVQSHSVPSVSLLAAFGANKEDTNLSIIKSTISSGRLDVLLALLLHGKSFSRATLIAATEVAFKESNLESHTKFKMMEALLSSGAQGPQIADILATCADKGYLDLVRLLVDHNTSIEYSNAKAVRNAVSNGNLEVFNVLMSKSHISPENATRAMASIPENSSNQVREEMVSHLLSLGATGDPVSRELVRSVSVGRHNTTKLLLKHRASLDYQQGAALAIAVRSGNLQVVEMLLKNEPSQSTLSNLFPKVREVCDKSKRYDLTHALLNAGSIKTETLDSALLDAVYDRSSLRDEKLMTLLSAWSANPGFNNGQALKILIDERNLPMLKCLLGGPALIPVQILLDLVKFIMKEQDRKLRRLMMQEILMKRLRGPEVAQALCEVLESQPIDSALLELLVLEGQADINYSTEPPLKKGALSCTARDFSTLLRASNIQTQSAEEALRSIIQSTLSKEEQVDKVQLVLQHVKDQNLANFGLLLTVEQMYSLPINDDPDLSVLGALLLGGADVNHHQGLALRKMCEKGMVTAVELLIKYKASLETRSSSLFAAANHPDERSRNHCCQILVDHGIHQQALDTLLIHLTVQQPAPLSTCQLLLDAGANINIQHGQSILNAVSSFFYSQSMGLVELLLSRSPAPESLLFSWRLFNHRIYHGECVPIDLMDAFLHAGTIGEDVDETLIIAAQKGDEKLCNLLLQYKASVNHKNGECITHCVKQGSAAVLAKLLEPGLLAKYRDTLDSALIDSISARNLAQIDLLLEHGASINYQEGIALSRAVDWGESSVIDALLALESDNIGMMGVNRCLITAAKQGNLELCQKLIGSKASVDFNNGAPLAEAVNSMNIDLLQYMLTLNPSHKTKQLAFAAVKNLGHSNFAAAEAILKTKFEHDIVNSYLLQLVKKAPEKKDLIHLLLRYKASIHYRQDASIIHATVTGDLDSLKLLSEYYQTRSVFSHCFSKALEKGVDQPQAFEIFSHLLENGATGSGVDRALVQATKGAGFSNDFELVDLFLKYDADVDFEHGEALKEACKAGHEAIINKLLDRAPSSKTKSNALPILLQSRLQDSSLPALIRRFVETGKDFDVNSCDAAEDGIIRYHLEERPTGHRTLECLLSYGGTIEDTFLERNFVHYEDSRDPKTGAILFWCLQQIENPISPECVSELLHAGANMTCQHAETGDSPLIVAVRQRKPKFVSQLIENGASTSISDSKGYSPLFLATRNNDLDTMAVLLNAGPSYFDGSLHEAINCMHYKAIELLLNHGYKPNTPSPLHDGRSSLGVISSLKGIKPKDRTKLQDTISVLLKHGANKDSLEDGKPLVYAVMDNSEPMTILEALLVVYLSGEINNDHNILTDGKYRYSPMMYVSNGPFQGSSYLKGQILQTLRRYGAHRDVYYALKGPQPQHAVGLPPELQQEEDERRKRKERADALQAAQEKHLEELRKEAELTRQIEEKAHQAEMQREQERLDHERRLLRDRRKEEEQYREAIQKRELEHRQKLDEIDRRKASRRETELLKDIEAEQTRVRLAREASDEQERRTIRQLELQNRYDSQQHQRNMEYISMMAALPTRNQLGSQGFRVLEPRGPLGLSDSGSKGRIIDEIDDS